MDGVLSLLSVLPSILPHTCYFYWEIRGCEDYLLGLGIFVFCKYAPSLLWDAGKLSVGQEAFSLGLIFLPPALRPGWYPHQYHVPVSLMGTDNGSLLWGSTGHSLRSFCVFPPTPSPCQRLLSWTLQRDLLHGSRTLSVCPPLQLSVLWPLDHAASLDCTPEMLDLTPASGRYSRREHGARLTCSHGPASPHAVYLKEMNIRKTQMLKLMRKRKKTHWKKISVFKT